MNERLIEIRKSLNLSQTEFAEKIGLKQGSISDLETGRAKIVDRVILLICSKYHVNEHWLRTGKGNMFLEYDKKHDEFFETFQNLNPVLQDFLIDTAKNLLNAQNKL